MAHGWCQVKSEVYHDYVVYAQETTPTKVFTAPAFGRFVFRAFSGIQSCRFGRSSLPHRKVLTPPKTRRGSHRESQYCYWNLQKKGEIPQPHSAHKQVIPCPKRNTFLSSALSGSPSPKPCLVQETTHQGTERLLALHLISGMPCTPADLFTSINSSLRFLEDSIKPPF